MAFNIPAYLMAKNGNVPVGAEPFDIPAYLMAKAASGGGIKEITGTLPLTVRSRASQILKNYIIYGTASGAGSETENLFDYYATWESPYVTSVTSEPETNSFVVSGHYYAKCLVELSENTKYIMSYDVELVTEESRAQVLVYSEDMLTIISNYPKNSFNTGSNSKVYILFYCNTSPTISDTVRYINTMLTKGTTAPSSYIPHGYKLPLTVRAENLFNGIIERGGWSTIPGNPPEKYGANTRVRCSAIFETPIDNYTIAAYPDTLRVSVLICDSNGNVMASTGWSDSNYHTISNLQKCVFAIKNANDTNISPSDIEGVCIVPGSTAPSSYIPYYNTETPIYIGDSQLMAEEYVDYEEQKIYKLVGGVLTPTDPPVPLPDISLPQATVTIDIDGDIKPQATVKGKIEQI